MYCREFKIYHDSNQILCECSQFRAAHRIIQILALHSQYNMNGSLYLVFKIGCISQVSYYWIIKIVSILIITRCRCYCGRESDKPWPYTSSGPFDIRILVRATSRLFWSWLWYRWVSSLPPSYPCYWDENMFCGIGRIVCLVVVVIIVEHQWQWQYW